MSHLRLGAHNLPPAEVVLVQTLFRLFSYQGDFRWIFVTSPPYDALLVDGAAATGEDADTDRLAKAVLRLTGINAPSGPNTLARPIRADRLQEWLKATEHELLDTRPVTQPGHLPENEPPASLPQPLQFRLRRWPPAALLRGDPHRIRMATLLSRRALSAAELAALSQRPAHECQAFLHKLQTTGLVDIDSAASPRPAAAGAPPATPADRPKPVFARGLISSIRRRLGL